MDEVITAEMMARMADEQQEGIYAKLLKDTNDLIKRNARAGFKKAYIGIDSETIPDELYDSLCLDLNERGFVCIPPSYGEQTMVIKWDHL